MSAAVFQPGVELTSSTPHIMWTPSVAPAGCMRIRLLLTSVCPAVLLRAVWLCREFKATLDYVLYTRDSLAPSGLLELPSDAEVMSKPGDSLPNANWSSDHICLMSEFQILPHKTS